MIRGDAHDELRAVREADEVHRESLRFTRIAGRWGGGEGLEPIQRVRHILGVIDARVAVAAPSRTPGWNFRKTVVFALERDALLVAVGGREGGVDVAERAGRVPL